MSEHPSKDLRPALPLNAKGLIDSFPAVVFVVDSGWKLLQANAAFEQLSGQPLPEILGRTPWSVFPRWKGSVLEHELRKAARTGQAADFEMPHGSEHHWYAVHAAPLENGVAVYLADSTSQKRDREVQAFLTQSSEVLSSSLDYETTLTNMAWLAVPHIGDWCSIDIFTEDGQLKRVAVAHVNPRKIKVAEKFFQMYPVDLSSEQGVPGVLRTGKPELIPFIPNELLEQSAVSQEQLGMLRELEIHSYMIVPLMAKGRTFGAITLVSSDPKAPYDESDLAVAEELARRASLAVENARLYRTVQRSKDQLEMAQRAAHIASFEWNLKTRKATWTAELEALYGLEAGGFRGQLENWLASIHPEDRRGVEKAVRHSLAKQVELNVEYRVLWPDGSLHWLSALGHIFQDRDSHVTTLAGINMDITDRKATEEVMRHRAFHDSLTNLPNRLLLNDRLEVAITLAKRRKEALAILFLDLDRFKDINDSLGHSVGDQLLQEVARRLRLCVRVEDTVARFGGDEFLILLPEIAKPGDPSRLAAKVLNSLKPAITINDREIHLTASIGIATYPADGDSPEALLKNADAALYHAKASGRNHSQPYTPTMHLRSSQRLTMENDLRRALEQGEFSLHYQPVVDLKTGELVRAEALLRWQHPQKGIILPGDFISLAEETGLILPIGDWALATVCADLNEWRQEGAPACPIAINFSSRQFAQDDFTERIEATLRQHRVVPQLIQAEITEGVAMQNMLANVSKLNRLREVGIQVAVDDFGTGYSSLSYLKRLPVDMLKIDRSFIQHCTSDPRDMAIVQAIIAMAHTLGLTLCGEGIEEHGQLNFLRGAGCDTGQGHLFSEPLGSQAFSHLLRTKKKFTLP